MKLFFIYFYITNILIQNVYLSLHSVNVDKCRKLTLKNGKVRYRNRGRFVRFQCNMGYELAGERYSSCIDGKTEIEMPKCVRNTCYSVRPPYNGQIFSSHNGAVLHFYCKPGFKVHGPSTTYCDGRRWDTNLPSCLPTNSTPPLSCDFESPDLCGWTHDLNHDFDWTRQNFKTPSGAIGTGPSYDHTKGEDSDGYYMYIESSSRNPNDTAKLISPIYPKMPNSSVCFEFYYHMFGITMGSLRVYLKKISEPWNLTASKAFFVKSGNQGNKWYRGFQLFDSINEDYQIIIEGVRGNSYISDIAIDDVKIIENCSPNDKTTTTTEEYVSPEQPYSFESCRNRCLNNNNIQKGATSFEIICDCDETCYERNTCCPDYVDLCVLTDYSTETPNDITTSKTTEIPTTIVPSTSVVVTNTTIAEKITTTIKLTTNITNVKITTALPVFKPSNVTKKWKITRRPLIMLTPPTVPAYIEKINPFFTIPKKKIVNKSNVNQNEILKVPPNKTILTMNDALTVPPVTKADEPLFVIPTTINPPIATINIENEITRQLEEPLLTKLGESRHLHRSNRTDQTYLTVVVFSITIIIVLTTVTVTIVVIKCKLFRCRSLQNSPNGDSQSDVRFLTSDEILDLTLSNDYDL